MVLLEQAAVVCYIELQKCLGYMLDTICLVQNVEKKRKSSKYKTHLAWLLSDCFLIRYKDESDI